MACRKGPAGNPPITIVLDFRMENALALQRDKTSRGTSLKCLRGGEGRLPPRDSKTITVVSLC